MTKKKSQNREQSRGKFPAMEVSGNKMVVSKGIGMPKQFRCKLRFAFNGVVAVTGTNTGLAWGCNTPNQPNRSVSTTETPGYYTKLAGLYDRVYTVSSTIRYQAVNVTVADAVQIVLSNDGNSVVPTNIFEAMERTDAKDSILGHYQGGSTVARFNHQWFPKPFIGVPPDSPDNTVVAADPPNTYLWFVDMQTLGGGTGNVAYQVVIEYDVVFHELTLPY